MEMDIASITKAIENADYTSEVTVNTWILAYKGM